MAIYQMGFVQPNNSPVPDGNVVNAISTDGSNTVVETSVIGANNVAPNQGVAAFLNLVPGTTYNFVFNNSNYAPRAVLMPATPYVIVGPQGTTGISGHGSTESTASLTMTGKGTTYTLPVIDSIAFPATSNLFLTDGTNHLYGNVSSNTNNILTFVSTLESGTATIPASSVVTFAGVAIPAPYDLIQTYEVSNSGPTTIFTHIVSRAFSLQQTPPNGGTNVAYAAYDNATQNIIFNINKNGTAFGTLTFNSGNAHGVFVLTGTTNFAVSDFLSIDFASSSDSTAVSQLDINNFIITLCTTLL